MLEVNNLSCKSCSTLKHKALPVFYKHGKNLGTGFPKFKRARIPSTVIKFCYLSEKKCEVTWADRGLNTLTIRKIQESWRVEIL